MENTANAQANAQYDPRFSSVEDMRLLAKKRMPKFVFDYLDGGCNEEVNLRKNTSEIRDLELLPQYLEPYAGASMRTQLFGQTYDAPFGVAPVGLQGFMWPNAAEVLASAARAHNIPFILSTVTTSSIEKTAKLTDGNFWFQLYHPSENSVRDDLLVRAKSAGCEVLVLTCDLPIAAFRPKDIKNGLAMPPKKTVRNMLQIIGKPLWAMQTLRYGPPKFEVLKPYMHKKLNLRETGEFMDRVLSTRMDEAKIAAIRDLWPGKLVLKGITTEADTEAAIRLGADGIIVSNHGGRQLDAGESTIKPLTRIAKKYGDQITVMMDSGLRTGPDIARTLASGAAFTFLGRSFMYGVCALGTRGGGHSISLLKAQFQQIMEQVGCEDPKNLPRHLVQVQGRATPQSGP